MTDSAKGGQIHREAGLWWTFLLHQLQSTLGILVLAGFLTFSVSTPSRAHRILTETPYFPVQIVLALCVGFGLRRYMRDWVMEWVWVLPFLILCVAFARTHLPFGNALEYFFGRGCRPEFHCVDQLAITLPFYAATSYSVGAFLSRHLKGHTQENEITK